ncbi:uncharacterized protein isoform X2 [Musca autumnalis]|uniref:uncharacterized protein isoform X2 n=1 Tax=Musca autumnalis TaxID=221902 RepID=UPI003CF77C6E
MSGNVSIKTEPFTNDYEPEDSNNDAYKLGYSATNVEHFTNIGIHIKRDELDDLDKMEEFLPENVNEYTIDVIKKQDVDEMEEFLPEDSPSFYSPSLITWKTDDRTEEITHDEVQHQHVAQQHLTNTTTQQISLPKLELMDVHTEDDDSEDDLVVIGDTDANVSDNKERSDISSTRSVQIPNEHKCELCASSFTRDCSLKRHMREKHPLSIDTEYICETCNQRFTTQKGLVRHSTRKHQTTTEHKCEICGSFYTESQSLRSHIRKKHPSSIDTEYICEICHQRFAAQIHLDMHYSKKHPGVHTTQASTKLSCEICGRYYTKRKTLREHIRKKHEYICEICHKKFITKLDLDLHCTKVH